MFTYTYIHIKHTHTHAHIQIGDKSASLPVVSTTSNKPRLLSPALLKKKIEEDYANAYFLTGQISADAYDEDCVFTGKFVV